MDFIQQLVPEKLVYALGWTLLHSLWQGALAALVVAGLMLLLHRSSSTVRYFVATTALFSTFCVTVVTFLMLYHSGPTTEAATLATVNAPTTLTTGTTVGTVAAKALTQPSMLEQTSRLFTTYFNRHLPSIVTVWLMGMAFLLLRLMGSWAYLQRLRHYQVHILSAAWEQRLRTIQARVGIHAPVRLIESALVKVPMVVGYFKPVILLPIGTVAGLSVAQVEAVLAHELAHIRRSDYFVNLLQSVIEIVFFYHPAIWWLSGCVREEREHCCDDIAIAVCGDSLTYAKALATVAAIPVQTPALAMGLTGKSGMLLSRIERFMKQPQRSATFSEGMLAALVLVAGIFFVSVSAQAGFRFNRPANQPASNNSPVKVDPQQPPQGLTYHYVLDDTLRQRSEMTIVKDKKGRIVELYIDGKKIPKDQIENYLPVIADRTKAIPAPPAPNAVPSVEAAPPAPEATASPAPAVAPAPMVAIRPTAPLPPAPATNHVYTYDKDEDEIEEITERAIERVNEQLERVQENMERISEDMEREVERSEGQREEAMRKLEAAMQQQERAREKLERQHEEIMQQHEREMEVRHSSHERAMQEHERADRNHQEEMRRHALEMKKHGEEMKKSQRVNKALLSEMKKDGLIQDEHHYEFRLNGRGELSVNGKKQPDSVYQKYKKIWEKETGSPLNEKSSIHMAEN